MQPVNLFDLASQQARWLSVRQATVAGNVANINTPGYQEMEVEAFRSVLDSTSVNIGRTNPRHLTPATPANASALGENKQAVAVESTEKPVVMESELLKTGDIHRAFELNTAIVKSFHRMLLMTTRS